MMKRIVKYTIFLALVGLIFRMGYAMSLFGIGKVCVFSDVTVRLLQGGKPVANKRVVRKWDWNKLETDEGVTDENGDVSFPVVYDFSLSRLLPIELVIGQQLSVELDGEQKVFWSNAKREPELNAEYGGDDFLIVCELNDEEVLSENYGSLMVSRCKPQNSEQVK